MKIQSTIASFRFGKNGCGILLANGQTIPVSEQLLDILAKSTGFSARQQLVLNGIGATITVEKVDVKQGQQVLDNNGKIVLNKASGQPLLYSKDHTRYNNITIALSQVALIAANVGAQLASMFVLPTAPQTQLPANEPALEEIPGGEFTDATVINEPAGEEIPQGEPVFAGAEEATN